MSKKTTDINIDDNNNDNNADNNITDNETVNSDKNTDSNSTDNEPTTSDNNADNNSTDDETIDSETYDADLDIQQDFPTMKFQKPAPDLRARAVMYTQKIEFIKQNFGSVAKFIKHVEKLFPKGSGIQYALIIHDKDPSQVEGKSIIDPHIHLVILYPNARYFSAIAKSLKDTKPDGSPNVNALTKFDRHINNMWSYICHRTKNAAHKYQYDPKDVIANFDYVSELANITQQVKNAMAAKPEYQALIYEQLKNREITLLEAENMLPAKVYSTQVNYLRNVSALANKLEAKEWRERRQASNDFTKVIWIWGDAGTGKTRLATEIASGLEENYFYSGAERGVWDDYEATQHVAVIDECRPVMFESFREMLTLLDNYQTRAVASARYYNRELALDYIIITSVYNPYYFYNNMEIIDKKVDCFHQLERRISCCIFMDGDFIYDSFYSPLDKNYITNTNTIIKNPFSEKKLSHSGISPVSIDFRKTVFQSSSVIDYYDAVDSSYCEDAFNDDDEFEVIADDIYSDYGDTYSDDGTYSDYDDDYSDYDDAYPDYEDTYSDYVNIYSDDDDTYSDDNDTNSGYDTDNDCEENS